VVKKRTNKQEDRSLAGKVLYVLSEFGYWGVELLGPLLATDEAGYEALFVTPRGHRPHALPPSVDPLYIDPPLGCAVTDAETAEKVKTLDATRRLDNPIDLSAWAPERPYFSASEFLRQLEDYYDRRARLWDELDEYAALVLVGGSGPLIDMANNQRVHDLILGFHHLDKPIAAICYGVAPLAFARELDTRQSLIQGKHVTGHCIEYDYKDGTGFLNTDLNMGPPPYPLEYILRDAVGPAGQYHGNFGRRTSVIVDWPFITARSLQCSFEFGEQLINMLQHGLRRYGW
jgi:putative intracellular protease/amidase